MPEYQNQQMHFQMPSAGRLFTPVITWILGAMLVLFVLCLINAELVTGFLGLSGGNIASGKIWTLFTYVFVNSDPLSMVFNGLAVLFLGSMIERQWDRFNFIMLWLAVSVVCGVIFLLFFWDSAAIGPSPCIFGFIGAMGLLMRGRVINFFMCRMRIRTLIWIAIIAALIMSIRQPANLVWIAGAAVAYVYIKLCWKIRSAGSGSAVKPETGHRSGDFIDLD
ncbi:Rhomboid family protein [Limihaloglobus sulfuriphilus]|uniref:Rhomboid family protein n=1 Tax=Limihaloglobus sulfuriphilus TaxID=1851148 RepID=A0A1Q2MHD6_9BACT|nr:rhomboid family intramembrane serine protease [Limihaloglobus sulfuriphilus]AQQ71707.1 Rhomboid family protein [Limihaloglobus sulfuriphilus]